MTKKKSPEKSAATDEQLHAQAFASAPTQEAVMPLVIGVGASAGGLEAFTQLLKGLPEKPGFAVVFVQHLAPQHESALAILLSDATRMPVWQVENGMPLEYDRVNVIPPNVQLR